MTMKTVAASESFETENASFELALRQCARKIIEKVFPNTTPDFRLIEHVTREIIITDEDGILEKETDQETENLIASRTWAKDAYGDDSPAATMAAYEVLHGMTDGDRWFEVNEKLDALSKRKK